MQKSRHTLCEHKHNLNCVKGERSSNTYAVSWWLVMHGISSLSKLFLNIDNSWLEFLPYALGHYFF